MEYHDLLSRLESIERDLAHRQTAYEAAAGEVHRYIRDFDLRLAQVKRITKGDTETAKKDAALDSIAAADDGLYSNLTDADSRYSAQKVVIHVLEKRASILQSILRAQTREVPQDGQQPQWSRTSA